MCLLILPLVTLHNHNTPSSNSLPWLTNTGSNYAVVGSFIQNESLFFYETPVIWIPTTLLLNELCCGFLFGLCDRYVVCSSPNVQLFHRPLIPRILFGDTRWTLRRLLRVGTPRSSRVRGLRRRLTLFPRLPVSLPTTARLST